MRLDPTGDKSDLAGKEFQAADIAVAKQRGVYTGRQRGTPRPHWRVRALRKRGCSVLEIAKALGVKERTVYAYLQSTRT